MTTPTTDEVRALIERLKRMADMESGGYDHDLLDIGHAAAALSALLAENERLQGYDDAAKHDIERMLESLHAESEARIAAEARVAALEGALRRALRFIEERADQTGYGFYRPANPHHFHPDGESCTPEEIAAHKAACDAFDKGEYTPPRGSETYRDEAGNAVMHILRAPWGIGSYLETDPDALPIIDAARAALTKEPTK